MNEQLSQLSKQQQTLRDQIDQSEKNLAAQLQVKVTKQEEATREAVRKAKWEHLQLLASDTKIDLDEMETVIHPIIESCTKDSISSGKSWIFQKATCHDNNQLVAHYLAYRVTQEDAPFNVKLHLIYLMNDVLHHSMRKHAEELKQSLESVAVEMFCGAHTSANDDQKAKLAKLIKLWEDKKIFSSSTLNKMKQANESWISYKDQMKENYASVIAAATAPSQHTYDNYRGQHQAFVAHATTNIQSLETQKIQVQEQISSAEAQKSKQDAATAAAVGALEAASGEQSKQQAPSPWQQDIPTETSGDLEDSGKSRERGGRSSRWDTGVTGAGAPQQQPQQQQQPLPPPQQQQQQLPPPQVWGSGPPTAPGMPPPGISSGVAAPSGAFPGPGMTPQGPGAANPPGGPLPPPPLPDLSKPPPGFAPPIDEKALVPSLPYYDLPAGLMVPMVKMEDSGYKPLDSKKIRLPPPTPPTERLLQALELFYAPPSHERPRDPEGWEMIGLYEFSRDKAEAIKKKAEDIESGNRERSPTASPEPFSNPPTPDRTPPQPTAPGRPRTPEVKEVRRKKRYEEEKPSKKESSSPRRNKRGRSRSRSRSRTRSRSRGSTPERGSRGRRRSHSRSPSPSGGYSMPSYLTKRSPSPRGGAGRGRGDSRSPSPRRRRADRSPSPPPPPSRRRRRSGSDELAERGGGGGGSGGDPSAFVGFAPMTKSAVVERLDASNKGHQMMQKMGWRSGSGLGSSETGIVEPISGGEVRDKQDQYKGVGVGTDPFEAFRKQKAGSFMTRMKDRPK